MSQTNIFMELSCVQLKHRVNEEIAYVKYVGADMDGHQQWGFW
jgi:hypothetical protein